MTQQSRRRHRRIPLRIPIILSGPRGDEQLLTDDISYAGVFVRTESPRKLRQLVHLKLPIPDEPGTELRMLAMVAHTIGAQEGQEVGRPPGMGLNLYGLRPDVLEQWSSFVQRTTEAFDALQDEPPTAVARRVLASATDGVVSIDVRPATIAQMYDLIEPDLSGSGHFVPTSEPVAPGSCRLIVFHPEDNSTFALMGRVLRREHRDGVHGVLVATDTLPAARRAAYTGFIESAIPLLEDDDILVEPDDSLLL